MASKQLTLELYLDEILILENGAPGADDALNGVRVDLIWPRPKIELNTAVKTLRLEDGRAQAISAAPFNERVLFKESVQYTFGLAVEITERRSPTALQAFLASAAADLLSAAWNPDKGDVFLRLVRTGAVHGLNRAGKAEDRVRIIGAGQAELEPVKGSAGRLKIPLTAPAHILKPGGAARTRRDPKILLAAGAPNGHIILRYAFND